MKKYFTNDKPEVTNLRLTEIKKSWPFIEHLVSSIQTNIYRQKHIEVRYCTSPCFDDEDFFNTEDSNIQYTTSKLLSIFRKKSTLILYTDEILINRIGKINDISVVAERLPDVLKQLIYDTLIITSTLENGLLIEQQVVRENIRNAIIDVLKPDIGLHNLVTVYNSKVEFLTEMLLLVLLQNKKCLTNWSSLANKIMLKVNDKDIKVNKFTNFSRNDIMNIPYSIAERIDLPMNKDRINLLFIRNPSLTYLFGHRVISGLNIAMSFLHSRHLSRLNAVDNTKVLDVYISKDLDESLYRSITNNLKNHGGIRSYVHS